MLQGQGKSSEVQESDFLGTLLRDTTSSHLLEVILMHAPQEPFDVLWNLHFKGRLAKLGVHPIANFVVAKAATRASENQILELVEEVGDGWNKLISQPIISQRSFELTLWQRHQERAFCVP